MSRSMYVVCKASKNEARAWKLTKDGDVLGYFDTQACAIEAGAMTCRLRLKQHGLLSELKIMGRNGKIRDSRTYGRDPVATKG